MSDICDSLLEQISAIRMFLTVYISTTAYLCISDTLTTHVSYNRGRYVYSGYMWQNI